ncbi:DUF2254 domain-containing protein [Capillimicrobium parvum]|uniref:DUF2254 domain-containing protein n=1 Tax=Capillimicrobium parvum TaxID=2884022 RepID=A0A9E6Y0J6_9ACTN|nr:DUF2254 domain-containing protein [Capillimicrobium parvum]UGS37206.1 hypothetical protein DSM104329_03621 [Capillimicrobium parvum]
MRLWVVPLSGLVAGLGLALITLSIDRSAGYDLLPQSLTGTPTVASSLLTTIITSVVTLLSVVLTVMTVAVQLAMAQFSPRIVAALLQDRLHQLTFALFSGTAAFAIVALVGVDDRHNRVPGLTVLLAYVLALTSLALLVIFVSHAGLRLRASGLIDIAGDQLGVEIDRRFPPAAPAPLPRDTVAAATGGIVTRIDTDRLLAAASREGCMIELCVRMGDFVPAGAPLLHVRGAPAAKLADAAAMVELRDERTHDLDPAYGFRKLVDIAVRSAANDPSTSVEALHRIHGGLRQLARRPFPTGRHTDGAGELRLVTPVRDWGDFVRLGFEEIRLAGARQPQIARRMRAALDDLQSVVTPERRPPLDEQLVLLERAVDREHDDPRAARFAHVADRQGIG